MKTLIYGRNKTIHRTKLLNIEIDRKTKEVVAVWFRCMALPFDIHESTSERSKEMKEMYSKNKKVEINAIELEIEDD